MLGIFCRDIEVNSKKDDVEKSFIKFIKSCNWLKKYINVSIICSKKDCVFPAVMKFKLTENEDLDELLESIKNNDYTNFIKKNLKDEDEFNKIDLMSLVNKEVSYTMSPSSNNLIIGFSLK